MNKIIRYFTMLILFMSLFIQTGCWDQKQYEEIGFILQMGLEVGKDDKMLLSITAPVVSPDAEKKVEFLNISNENLVRPSRDNLRNVSGKFLQGGKIQILYFSKELAEKGINEYLEIFHRDPENPLLSNVVVVDKSPKEMMEKSIDFKDKPRPSIYAAELLRDARRRLIIPETRVYNFSILYHSKTIDPVTPLFRYDDKSFIVSGAAVFSGDKMVGEINPDETKLLNVLKGKKQVFEYIYRGNALNNKDGKLKKGAAVSLKCKKNKIKIDTSSKKPVINITLRFIASMDEFSGKQNLDKDHQLKKVERVIAESLYREINDLLKKLQSFGADPIGFGERVRAKQNSYWKSVKWKEVYKTAQIKLNIGVEFETYGTIR